MTIVKNQHQTEEITQNTFYKAMTAKKAYAGRSSELTWLCNIARKEAEAKLTSLLANKEPLCLCLSQLLTTSNELLVQSYAAIIIRKLFIVKDDEISSDVWKSFKDESKTTIKANLFFGVLYDADILHRLPVLSPRVLAV